MPSIRKANRSKEVIKYTINKNMHSSIDAKMETIKQDLSTQLASFTSMICTKLNIPTDLPSSNSPLHSEGETSSNSLNF